MRFLILVTISLNLYGIPHKHEVSPFNINTTKPDIAGLCRGFRYVTFFTLEKDQENQIFKKLIAMCYRSKDGNCVKYVLVDKNQQVNFKCGVL